MHYVDIDVAIAAADPTLLKEHENAACVRGCYRCVLSYYNQPDHELIDRTDPAALLTLLRLARSTVVARVAAGPAAATGSWAEAVKRWALPPPDMAPEAFGGAMPLSWSDYYVAAGPLAAVETVQTAADALGFLIVAIADPSASDAPPALLAALKGTT
jgi:hypothetical protein